MTADAFRGWPTLLTELLDGQHLSSADAAAAMSTILAGEAADAQIAAYLVALRAKGVHADELVGMLDATLAASPPVPLTDDERDLAVDVVGTGGDGTRSINVSTMAAIVAAASGAAVCKHGARSASSHCGAADVLEALGVAIELSPDGVARCLRDVGIGFCFAPAFHPAFRFAGPPRKQIGIPTAFNMIGPMANPGRVRRQLIGVADASMAAPILKALADRGLQRAWVVHGSGLDELTTTGTSTVLELRDGATRTFDVDATDYGMPRAAVDDLAGEDLEGNVAAVRAVFAGARGPHRDIVVLNAGAALVVAGLVEELGDGIAAAAAAIDAGEAESTLDAWVRVSNES